MRLEKSSFRRLYGKKSRKMLIGIWVTTGCNLRCKYCYEGTEKKLENMNTEVADKTVKFIQTMYNENEHNPLVVEFHGGEPLLNYSIIQYLILKIEKIFPRALFGITTNGLCLTREKIQYLSDKMNYGFSLSIDGDRETNDQNRVDCYGNGTYEKIREIIPELLMYRGDIRARMTYTPETVESLADNIIHLINCGFTNIVSAPDYFSSNWSMEKMDILLKQMMKVKNYYKKRILQENPIRISLLEDRFKTKGICQGGKTNFHVLPNGDIYPCSYGVGETELLIGNVLKGFILESKIQKLGQINISPVHKCQGCKAYAACISSRCKIFNKVLQGDYFEPVPVICAIEHVKQKFWVNSSK